MVKRASSVPAATDAKWMSERAAIVFATTFYENRKGQVGVTIVRRLTIGLGSDTMSFN
jgi:hypothetical protein